MDRDNQQERFAAFDMGWAIGMFEGEGSVSLATSRNHEQVVPRISIANMDQKIIDKLVEILNAHNIACYVYWSKNMGRLTIAGAKRVERFAEFALPVVVGDKKLKLAIALQWVRSRFSGKRTSPYKQYEWWLFKELRRLNDSATQHAIDRKVAKILRDYTPDSHDLPYGMKI